MCLECKPKSATQVEKLLEVVQFPEEATTREFNSSTTTVARKLDEKSWEVSLERETNGDGNKQHEKDSENSYRVAGGQPLIDDSNGTSSNVQNIFSNNLISYIIN